MKYAVGLLAVSSVAMVLLVAHGVFQEVNLRELKTRTAAASAAVDVKEESIVFTKNQVAQLKIAMETERAKTKEMGKRREEVDNAKRESEEKLQVCNKEKEVAAENKTSTEAAIKELKEKKLVNEMKVEIEKLKTSIKDRDKALCALADPTKDEVKKLCAL